MKRLILHIGRHKTGTTNLQHFLTANQHVLRADFACYPETGRAAKEERDRTGHHELATALIQNDREHLASLQRTFLSEVAPYDPIIVSSEGFQNLDDLSVLREFFDGFQVEVVCYLREYLSYVASSYAQEIQTTALVADFSMFAEYCRFALSMRWFVELWQGFGRPVSWRLYDRSTLVGNDVVSDFLSVTNIPIAYVHSDKDTNRTISGNLLAFKLMVNALGLHHFHSSHVLGGLAASHRRFAGAFEINAEQQNTIRASNVCNAVLTDLFGELPLKDFSTGNRIWSENWRDDFALIREAFACEDLRDIASHPLLGGA